MSPCVSLTRVRVCWLLTVRHDTTGWQVLCAGLCALVPARSPISQVRSELGRHSILGSI